ncbi:Zinc finger HIT domain-containing protein 1 [Dermatophagoides pteronyssinus]|uniref:Zinc finger HIT domain-containing protein 1 n=1 Tax=Dermatophagoides pteronyssinus TaxID=6956 RepID=A0ABQ8JIK1_DERPT|nr:Zinc finger HIT domain-containing protein 1 [Dermatophagoides pteronyssinus]
MYKNSGQKPSTSSRISITRKQYRILDESTRNRRNRQHIEQLERDNFHEDPHSNLVMHKKAPKFEDPTAMNSTNNTNIVVTPRRMNVSRSRIFTLNTLIEENSRLPQPNYVSIATLEFVIDDKQSKSKLYSTYFPLIEIPSVRRHFCSVCGFKSHYTCIVCGFRYCSTHCLQIHVETRCLKWTG